MEQGKRAVFHAAGIPREGVEVHCKAGKLARGGAISIFLDNEVNISVNQESFCVALNSCNLHFLVAIFEGKFP